jgi:hypothetical protein
MPIFFVTIKLGTFLHKNAVKDKRDFCSPTLILQWLIMRKNWATGETEKKLDGTKKFSDGHDGQHLLCAPSILSLPTAKKDTGSRERLIRRLFIQR